MPVLRQVFSGRRRHIFFATDPFNFFAATPFISKHSRVGSGS
jgi:hypothetical protein